MKITEIIIIAVSGFFSHLYFRNNERGDGGGAQNSLQGEGIFPKEVTPGLEGCSESLRSREWQQEARGINRAGGGPEQEGAGVPVHRERSLAAACCKGALSRVGDCAQGSG